MEAVFELDVFGYRHSVLRDLRHAKRLVKDYIAATGSKSHLHCIGKHVATFEHEGACLRAEFDLLTGKAALRCLQ